jgi:hypothetical protein
MKETSSFDTSRSIQRLRVGNFTSAELLVLELKLDRPLPQRPTVHLRCLDLRAGEDVNVILAGAAYHKYVFCFIIFFFLLLSLNTVCLWFYLRFCLKFQISLQCSTRGPHLCRQWSCFPIPVCCTR